MPGRPPLIGPHPDTPTTPLPFDTSTCRRPRFRISEGAVKASSRARLFLSAPFSCILACAERRDVRMTQALQTEVMPRHDPRRLPAVAVLTALGVVYGDIGTSPLYGLKQAVDAGGGPAPETVMGVVSLIFWALVLIVGLKYAILILRADNHGEGGIVALLALLDARHAPRGSARASLLIVGLIGAALLYGDGVI